MASLEFSLALLLLLLPVLLRRWEEGIRPLMEIGEMHLKTIPCCWIKTMSGVETIAFISTCEVGMGHMCAT